MTFVPHAPRGPMTGTADQPTALVVPYVASWSEERPVRESLLRVRPDGGGLRWSDEVTEDRDDRGVLWGRTQAAQGTGFPQFHLVHPHRQRETMQRMLCQVCAQPASRTSRGWLFLMSDETAERMLAEGGDLCTQPPLCVPCAGISSLRCPHLRNRTIAIRAKRVRPYGVDGVLYAPTPRGDAATPVPHSGTVYPYSAGIRPLRWVLASQLVMQLSRVTIVDLDGESRHARTTDG